jgi:hypothetical protein
MRLNRAVKALKKKDWFTVSVEFLIVVLGIVLGLQANTWYERQKSIRSASESITTLKARLYEIDIVLRDLELHLEESLRESGRLITEVSEGKSGALDKDAIERGLRAASRLPYTTVQLLRLQALLNQEQLSSVVGRDGRRYLDALLEAFRLYNLALDNALINFNIAIENMGRYIGFGRESVFNQVNSFRQEWVFDLEEIYNNPTLHRAIASARSVQIFVLAWVKEIRATSHLFQTCLLDEDLGKCIAKEADVLIVPYLLRTADQ